MIDIDTAAVAGDVRGGAARRRRCGRARRRAAGRRRRRPASPRCARPATTPSRRARWASASSTTSPWRRAGATAAHGVERVLILDWDVHHGNGTNDDLPRGRRRPVRLDPRVAAVSGDRAGERSRVGRGRGLHRQPAGAVGQRRRDLSARWSTTSCAPLIRDLGAAARARLGRLRRAPRSTRWPTAGSPSGGYAAMTASLRRACAAVGAPLGLVLEGGYSLEALCDSVARAGAGAGRVRRVRGGRSGGPPAGGAGDAPAGALVARARSARDDVAHVGLGRPSP